MRTCPLFSTEMRSGDGSSLIMGGGGFRPLRGLLWISQIVHVFCFHLKVMLGSSSLPPPPTQPLCSAMRCRAASEGGGERVSGSSRIHVGGGCFAAWAELQMPPDLQLCSKSH